LGLPLGPFPAGLPWGSCLGPFLGAPLSASHCPSSGAPAWHPPGPSLGVAWEQKLVPDPRALLGLLPWTPQGPPGAPPWALLGLLPRNPPRALPWALLWLLPRTPPRAPPPLGPPWAPAWDPPRASPPCCQKNISSAEMLFKNNIRTASAGVKCFPENASSA